MTAALDRLEKLGVPAPFRIALATRAAPRFHTAIHLTIILTSITAAVMSVMAWSRFVGHLAEQQATAAHALLYSSDIGAESLGLLLTALFAAGWICGAVTWRRGSEGARNGWAADLVHEPVRNKAVTDWLWRGMIRRHAAAATSADEFLDRLGAGAVRDIGRACGVMLLLTLVFGALAPAHVSYATSKEITRYNLLPFATAEAAPLERANLVVVGCPVLPKQGPTLIFRLQFGNGADESLGDWTPRGNGRLSALELIAADLPPRIRRARFTNAIGSAWLATECVEHFGSEAGPDGVARLVRLLAPQS